MNASGCLFKRSLAMEWMQQLESFKVNGDWFLYIQMAARATICYCPERLNHYRLHGASTMHAGDYDKFFYTDSLTILDALLKMDAITGKKQLRKHFIFACLNIAFLKQSIGKSIRIASSLLKQNFRLAFACLAKMIYYKMTRKKYRFLNFGK